MDRRWMTECLLLSRLGSSSGNGIVLLLRLVEGDGDER